MKPAVYHPDAQREAENSALYYEVHQPGLGHRFLEAVEVCQRFVQQHPSVGAPFESGTRRFRVKGFPFCLIYLEQAQRLFIVAVAHFSREPGYWRERLTES
jgi:toxin ParE1/3/4